MRDGVTEPTGGTVLREAPYDRPERDDRRAEQDERSCDCHQEKMLRHVRRQELMV